MHPRTHVPLAPAQLGENVLLLGDREAGRLLSAQGGHSSGVVRACSMGAEHGSSQTGSSLPSGGSGIRTSLAHLLLPISLRHHGTLEGLVGRAPECKFSF